MEINFASPFFIKEHFLTIYFTRVQLLFMENLLYLHGLDGSLSDEKRAIMEGSYNVIAPQIDYRKDNVDAIIDAIFKENEIRAVIGSSMGGYVGYHISRKLELPCLLFNPAIFSRSIELKFTSLPKYDYYVNQMVIVLGKKDKVVNGEKTMRELTRDSNISLITFCYYRNLEHRIDIDTFEEEFTKFCNLF